MQNSIGNLKNSGLQGNNFPWQLKMLLGQQCACDALQDIAASTDTLEPLLAQILAAIQNGTDYEAALVVDDAGVTWLEIRIWNPATGTFDPPIYFAAGSNVPGSPVLPITYINPNSYLAQIVSYTSNLVSIEAGTPDALGQTTMSASMPVTIASDQTALPVTAVDLDIRNLDCATDTVSVCSDGSPVGTGNPLPVSLATGSGIFLTPVITLASGSNGTIPDVTYSVSFASNGTADALISFDGGLVFFPIPSGTTVNMDAGGINNTYAGGLFSWDTTTNSGSSLLITYNI